MGVAVALLGLTGCWPAPGAGPDRRSENTYERTITLDTVERLEPAWTSPLAGGAAGHPVAAGDGLVHVASPTRLYTLATADGTERWTHDAPPGETIDPVIVRGPRRVDRPEGPARLGYSTSDPLIAQRAHWVDPLTGSGDAINGPGGGTIDGIRGGWGLTTHRFSDWLDWYDVAELDYPGARYGGPIGPHRDAPRATLGEDAVFQVGFGPATATLWDTSMGNAVRALPRRFGQVVHDRVCGADWYQCPIWATPVDGTAWTEPVLTEDQATVFVGTDAGTLYALDTADGAIRWTASLGAAVTAPPALAGGVLYVPTGDGQLVALAAGGCGAVRCGRLWWGVTGGRVDVQPAVAGGVVFTGSVEGWVKGFATAGCADRAVADQAVGDGRHRCDARWKYKLDSAISGAPAISGGRLFVGTAAGTLVAFAPS